MSQKSIDERLKGPSPVAGSYRSDAKRKVGEREGAVLEQGEGVKRNAKKTLWYTTFGPIEVVELILIQGGARYTRLGQGRG